MKKFLTIAILSISMITVMASAAVSPALANISMAFPDANVNMIKTVLTLPSLFIIPFSLLSNLIVKKIGNKRVLVIGILVYLVGGVGAAFVDTLKSLLMFRAILGSGCGLIMPISQALIAENFEGEMKTKITGYSGAASYLMGVIASFVVAPISNINWHYSFYIYTIAIVVLVLNVIALPNEKPEIKKSVAKDKLPIKTKWIILGMLLVNIAFYAVPSNISLFMREQGIGSSKSPGMVISVFMISGFIAGIILYSLQTILKQYTISFGIGIMALGYICLSISRGLLPVVLGTAFVGFSFGILFPSILVRITDSCSMAVCTFALSLSSCAQFLGQFVSPYILQLIKNIIRVESLRYDFTILAVLLTAAVIIFLGYFILKGRNGRGRLKV